MFDAQVYSKVRHGSSFQMDFRAIRQGDVHGHHDPIKAFLRNISNTPPARYFAARDVF